MLSWVGWFPFFLRWKLAREASNYIIANVRSRRTVIYACFYIVFLYLDIGTGKDRLGLTFTARRHTIARSICCRVSVCLSVSHRCLLKRVSVGSCKHRRTIAQALWLIVEGEELLLKVTRSHVYTAKVIISRKRCKDRDVVTIQVTNR